MFLILSRLCVFRPMIEAEQWAVHITNARIVLFVILLAMIFVYAMFPYKRSREKRLFCFVYVVALVLLVFNAIYQYFSIDADIDAGHDRIWFMVELLVTSVIAQPLAFYGYSVFAKNRKHFCRIHEHLRYLKGKGKR